MGGGFASNNPNYGCKLHATKSISERARVIGCVLPVVCGGSIFKS